MREISHEYMCYSVEQENLFMNIQPSYRLCSESNRGYLSRLILDFQNREILNVKNHLIIIKIMDKIIFSFIFLSLLL